MVADFEEPINNDHVQDYYDALTSNELRYGRISDVVYVFEHYDDGPKVRLFSSKIRQPGLNCCSQLGVFHHVFKERIGPDDYQYSCSCAASRPFLQECIHEKLLHGFGSHLRDLEEAFSVECEFFYFTEHVIV